MTSLDAVEIHKTIRKWASVTGLPLSLFAEQLGISLQDILKGQPFPIKERSGLFENKLGIDFGDFISGRVDSSLLRSRMVGEVESLPPRYDRAKRSKVRSSANLVEYLRFVKGWKYVDQFLANLHIHPHFFENFDAEINFLFFMDLFEEIDRQGVNEQGLRQMAFHSVVKNLNTPLGQMFSRARNNHELYSLLSRHITNFDTNFNYSVEIKDDRAAVIVRQAEELRDDLHLKILGTRRICIYKQHVFSSMPLYRNAHALPIHESACMYLGDSHCKYSVPVNMPKLRLLSSEAEGR